MQGRAKQLIDELVALRTNGNPSLAHFVRAQLMMRGINPDRIDASTPDDPRVITELQQMIASFSR